jgi:hypothetical protein
VRRRERLVDKRTTNLLPNAALLDKTDPFVCNRFGCTITSMREETLYDVPSLNRPGGTTPHQIALHSEIGLKRNVRC